jgi:hypothetical protein
MIAISDMTYRNRTLNLFEQVYTSGWWSNLRRMLGCRSCELLELGALAEHWTVRNRRFAGRQMVPISEIRGSENRMHDFDADFRPRGRHTVERWCRVAEAWWAGVELPPVELIQVGDAYFVRDGHHRISVARTFGAREIDALVTVWVVDRRLSWPQPMATTPIQRDPVMRAADQPLAAPYH